VPLLGRGHGCGVRQLVRHDRGEFARAGCCVDTGCQSARWWRPRFVQRVVTMKMGTGPAHGIEGKVRDGDVRIVPKSGRPGERGRCQLLARPIGRIRSGPTSSIGLQPSPSWAPGAVWWSPGPARAARRCAPTWRRVLQRLRKRLRPAAVRGGSGLVAAGCCRGPRPAA